MTASTSFTSDDHIYRFATGQSRASGWKHVTFPMKFYRHDYAALLNACRITKQSTCKFLQEAALDPARFILQVEHLARGQ
jgi:hypothetical protein